MDREPAELLEMGQSFCSLASYPAIHGSAEHVFQQVHWGLELVLKAYLHVHGWSDVRCITEVRHNIAIALLACERDGLQGIDDASRSLVAALSPFSTNHRVAEFVAAGSGGFSPGQAEEAVQVICKAVETALRTNTTASD